MKKNSLHVLFFIRKHTLLKNGEAPICFRLTIGKHKCDINLKRSVNPVHWNQQKECIRAKDRISPETNAYIESVRSRLHKISRDLESDDRIITAEMVRNRYYGSEEETNLISASDP